MTLYGQEHFYRRRLTSLLALYGRFWLFLLLFTAAAFLSGQGQMITGDWLASAVLCAGMMVARGQYLHLRTLFFAPLTGMILITLLVAGQKPKPVEKLFLFFGKHSTNIWLTHSFFYLTLFVNLVYVAKHPPLIYAFMLAICLALSYGINFLYKPLQKQILKLNNVAKV